MDHTSTDSEPHAAALENPAAIRNWMDARLDFPQSASMRKSYIVASSYRCGSTLFCSELWRTGVLGAPSEYLNIGAGRMLRDVMANRLKIASPEDYFAKLIARRTSRSGVFGMKAHFHHFEAALHWCPSMIELLSPLTYIYLNRRDKLAQAVSMAKAMQTDAWTTMDGPVEKMLRYNEALINRCLEDIGRQRAGWLRWFDTNNVTPIVVNYEDLLADKVEIIRSVVALFDVQGERAEEVFPPIVVKQGDETNIAWAARFRRDNELAAASGAF